eukprot:Amastigsp_a342756_45.p2 type:complete len:187 gc:universal Amastigsp_a342756_45:999-439(-)
MNGQFSVVTVTVSVSMAEMMLLKSPFGIEPGGVVYSPWKSITPSCAKHATMKAKSSVIPMTEGSERRISVTVRRSRADCAMSSRGRNTRANCQLDTPPSRIAMSSALATTAAALMTFHGSRQCDAPNGIQRTKTSMIWRATESAPMTTWAVKCWWFASRSRWLAGSKTTSESQRRTLTRMSHKYHH